MIEASGEAISTAEKDKSSDFRDEKMHLESIRWPGYMEFGN
jgi:hypothetical protein